jgi:transcriptional regulator with XRE-family HTH domain
MAPSELGFRLKCAREKAGLTQDDAARKSGVHVKTISSFESGARARSIKVAQLEALLDTYGLTVAQFFDPAFEAEIIAPTAPAPAPVLPRREHEPVDPLRAYRRDSDYPTAQSSLGGRICPPPYSRKA